MADNKGQYSLTDLAPTPAPAKPKQQGQFSESDLALNQQDALEPKQGDPDYSGIKEYAATGLEDLGNLIPNTWNLGGRFLSHPIDTTVQTVNSFLNFPDTFANEWTSGHPGRALMHASELALPEVLGRAPGAMRAVADSDVFQAIKGGVKGGYEGAMAPVEFTRFGMPVTLPASVVGGAAGGFTTAILPAPYRYAGPAIGAATPFVRGVMRGAKEAMLGAGSEEAELNALAREHFNKPFSALKGDDAETIQQLRRFQQNAAETVPPPRTPAPPSAFPPEEIDPNSPLNKPIGDVLRDEYPNSSRLSPQELAELRARAKPIDPTKPFRINPNIQRTMNRGAASGQTMDQVPSQASRIPPRTPAMAGKETLTPSGQASEPTTVEPFQPFKKSARTQALLNQRSTGPTYGEMGGAGRSPRQVPTTNPRVRTRQEVMDEVNQNLNLKANVPEGTGDVYKSQGGEAASSHIQAMQAKDAAIADYLRKTPEALGGKRWSELTDPQREGVLKDINTKTGKKYTYSPNTAARAGEIDRLLQK